MAAPTANARTTRLVSTRAIAGKRIGGSQQGQAHQPGGGEHATQPADARQDDAFRHDLRGQLPARRAERRAHDQLVPARRGPRQQQIADVRAGDEQHQADGAEQRQQDRAAIAHEVVGEADDVDADVAIRFGVFPRQPRGDARGGGARAFHAHVVAQPRDAHRAVADTALPEERVVVLADRDVDVVQDSWPRDRVKRTEEGATPTIVWARPSSTKVVPRTPGSASSRLRQ